MEDLRGFTYESGLPDSTSAGGSVSSKARALEPVYNAHVNQDGFDLLNIKKVPQNIKESVMKRGLKVNRLLRKHFKTQEEFESKIGEIADGKVIEIEKLKKLVSETCHEELSQ